jgi:rhamnose transport system ATP-binding protein
MPEQQMVETAKAIGADAKVVIMDEPTASLMDHEVERLFRVIERLRAEGGGIIYISHRLEELFAVSDRITVLRDGEAIVTCDTADIDRPTLIQTMVGRELAEIGTRPPRAAGEVALELRRVSNRSLGIHDVSLQVRHGEVLGLAGLVGSGRTELAETLFGLEPAGEHEGEILVNGVVVRIESPAQAVRLGIGYVPEDRRQHGVVLEMPIASNASLASLSTVSSRGLIDRAAERRSAEGYVERLRIKTSSVSSDVGALSGGNQQKVALARWLSIEPGILILDEPTQGVDVGAKAEIHALIHELAERGLAIVMISSELPEVLAMSDRVAVMHAGTLSGMLSRDEATRTRSLRSRSSQRPGDPGSVHVQARPPVEKRRSPLPSSRWRFCPRVAAPGYFPAENLSDLFLASLLGCSRRAWDDSGVITGDRYSVGATLRSAPSSLVAWQRRVRRCCSRARPPVCWEQSSAR